MDLEKVLNVKYKSNGSFTGSQTVQDITISCKVGHLLRPIA